MREAKRAKHDDELDNESDELKMEKKQATEPNAPNEKPAVIEERTGEIEFHVVNNDNTRESLLVLNGLKCVLEQQLSKMPKAYITRLVYDRTHLSLAIVKKPLQVLGGITCKLFNRRQFAEIVFFAISPGQQGKGYGAHLMSHLKDYVKATSDVMHFLTYADNSAINFFKKQGFTREITLPDAVWKGCIKDYQGGTPMQCSMLPRIRYLEARRMLLEQKKCVDAKLQALTNSHEVHQPPKQWKDGLTAIDPLSIKAIRQSGHSHPSPYYGRLLAILNGMEKHEYSWPFREPVDRDANPDYYKIIEHPMDLSKMWARLEADAYPTPREFLKDARRIFKNCRKFNAEDTVYVQAANKLEEHMWQMVRAVPEWKSKLFFLL
ncbi:Bromodomain-containing protein [Nemania sp. FL0031]|nr:Bromodomain-containing protein [Nemania sp. FL0031]